MWSFLFKGGFVCVMAHDDVYRLMSGPFIFMVVFPAVIYDDSVSG
jgi:hypothetical protein